MIRPIPKQLSKAVLGVAVAAVLVLLWLSQPNDGVVDQSPADSLEDPIVYIAEKRGVTERTNTWFSSLYRSFPSAPLFVFPGAYQFSKKGLSISGSQSVPTEKTIFGSFDPFCDVNGGKAVESIAVERYGDWDVSVMVKPSAGEAWRVHLVQGSPVVNISDFVSVLKPNCRDGIQLSRYRSDALLVKRGDQNILLIQAADTEAVEGVALLSGSDRYRIIQLPVSTDRSLDFLLNLPWTEVRDTQYGWSEVGDVLRTRLVSVTDRNEPLLTTLWPHHRLAGASAVTLGSYSTVYGRLDLVLANQIEFRQPSPVLPAEFEPVSDPEWRAKVEESLRADAERYQRETPPSGVYFRGAWLGGLASVILLTDAYGLEDERAALLDLLQSNLRLALGDFAYDDTKKMLIAAKNSEFGNEKGNDHHFHYGYYIRSGAVLVRYRPEARSEMEPILNEMALDIANSDRASGRYPFLRHFSPYAGHSWADGEALFQDGNNQESSSEALNAWYALSLWGEATGQEQYALIGRGLYAHELLGVRSYWFGESNSFPVEYRHPIVSLVWGGKRDYATWFSADPMHIQGIQWLPITPASEYLGRLPGHKARMQDIGLAPASAAMHEWGDLYVAYLSYHDPAEALRILELAAPRQAIKSTALLRHVVYSNQPSNNR